MMRFSFFHCDTVFVLIKASGIVMFAATQSLVDGEQVESISLKRESFLYGVSIIICVCLSCPEIFSSSFNLLLRSSVLAGIYPQKANDYPFSPEAISDIIRDEGPTAGTTSIPWRCASATSWAPGSATAGRPASEISATSFPLSNSLR